MWVSSSRVLTPRRRAFAKPGSDSSVVVPMPPRRACRSNWVFWGWTVGLLGFPGVAWATALADRHSPATLTAVATNRRALMRPDARSRTPPDRGQHMNARKPAGAGQTLLAP